MHRFERAKENLLSSFTFHGHKYRFVEALFVFDLYTHVHVENDVILTFFKFIIFLIQFPILTHFITFNFSHLSELPLVKPYFTERIVSTTENVHLVVCVHGLDG